MRTQQHVFFDLDGTVTDSKTGILNSVRHALEQFHISRTDAELLPFIGPPLRDSFSTLFPGDSARTAQAVAAYREYYQVRGMFENALYGGIADLLRDLRAAGRVVCLATSKPEPYALRILEHFGIAGLFDHVAGAELHGPRNSKEAVLRHACGLCRVRDMARCCMVGDRKYDVLGAHAVGMACVGVLYGYGSREELESAGVDVLCRDMAELRALLLGEGSAQKGRAQ